MSNEARGRVDAAMRVVVSLAGVMSILVLGGIFLLLAWNAASALSGGVELQPLAETEKAALSAKEVADIESTRVEPPSLVSDFLSSSSWRPTKSGAPEYGVMAMVVSTLLTTGVAMLIAVPLGVATAAWLAFVAKGRVRQSVKFGVELLAAIPSVVVGFIGIHVTGPLIGDWFGTPGGLTALNGGVLLAIISLPTIVSLSEDALTAVPRALIDGALALGADRIQTLWQVAIPAARSGLFASAMLGMGRAIGETMTVLMATGNVTAMPSSLVDPVRTMTATLAIEMGEVARGTTHYYSLFVVGLLLFFMTLQVNLLADMFIRRASLQGA